MTAGQASGDAQAGGESPSDLDPAWRFPPQVLREYALLADGHRGALCGPRGDVVWLCAPSWHDPAVFAALLGGAGGYAVAPSGRYVWGGAYEPGTLIWRNRWVTTDTIVECREALAFPGEPGRVVLLRRIEALEQAVTLEVSLDVRPDWGARMRELHRTEEGDWVGAAGGLRLRWSGAPQATVGHDDALHADVVVPAGGHHDLVLELTGMPLGGRVDPDAAWRATERAWTAQVPDCSGSVAPRDAQHAYAVLRGLTVPGGGMAAAATMSLPERAEQGRNYDYRYAWVRDQCYAGTAVAAHGPHPLLDDAVRFITARLLDDGDRLRPGYRVDGGPIPEEQQLPLPGYPGAGMVIQGNQATDQFQLDCFGEVLQLLTAAARHDRLDQDGWRALQVAAEVIGRRWQQPEAGLWELDDEWWTHSRLSCVAGLHAAASVASSGHDAGRMVTLADAILAETTKRCLHRSGRWQRSPHHEGVDAALLLPPVRGGLAADDPRTRATLTAVHDDLAEDGYLYRFRHSPRPLGESEGAFLLCGFFMSLALWQQGDHVGAFRWFERNRAACGPPALLAEEYDVRQRQLRGNLPQAFVHALLLECAARLTHVPPEPERAM